MLKNISEFRYLGKYLVGTRGNKSLLQVGTKYLGKFQWVNFRCIDPAPHWIGVFYFSQLSDGGNGDEMVQYSRCFMQKVYSK